jgi:dipeptide/tripeptide permease
MYNFHMNQDAATVQYHSFSFAYHITPLVGAALADGFIGRYATILTLSIAYFIGTFVLSITAIPEIGHHRLYVSFARVEW